VVVDGGAVVVVVGARVVVVEAAPVVVVVGAAVVVVVVEDSISKVIVAVSAVSPPWMASQVKVTSVLPSEGNVTVTVPVWLPSLSALSSTSWYRSPRQRAGHRMSASIPEARVSRTKEFFKGFFWPPFLVLVGWASYFPIHFIQQDATASSRGSLRLGAMLCIGGSLGLVLRFWGRSRFRAYGVLAGLLGAPLAVVAVVLLFVATLGRNVHF
jgi:hypothetical protein